MNDTLHKNPGCTNSSCKREIQDGHGKMHLVPGEMGETLPRYHFHTPEEAFAFLANYRKGE